MGNKRDIQQVNAIAQKYGMSLLVRKQFGTFLEKEKSQGHGGTLNAKGDFTWDELQQKAEEFLENF
ncbi:MAG: hypothetical protein VKK07_04740 [Merismopediaceae bacterium]|nr:hypothetical protein [Merismopediaceae bacterium]